MRCFSSSSFCRACAFTNRKVFQLNVTRAFLAIRYLNASDSLLCSTHSQCANAWLTASITITNFKNIFIAKELMGFSVCRAPLKATPPFRYCVRHLRAGNTLCSCRSCLNLLNNGRAAHTRIYIFHPKLFFVVFPFFASATSSSATSKYYFFSLRVSLHPFLLGLFFFFIRNTFHEFEFWGWD